MSIKNFTIVGERHTGTNLIEQIVKSTFKIPLTWEFGYKHWMGFKNDIISKQRETLFILTTRNPFDWFVAMYNIPHHVNPEICHSKDFYSKEWSSWYDSPSHGDRYNKEILMDKNMHTGQRYKNIFELRKVKTDYIAQFKSINEMSILCRYEDIVGDYDKTISNISKLADIPLKSKKKIDCYNSTRTLSPDIRKLIVENTDWKVEKKISYSNE